MGHEGTGETFAVRDDGNDVRYGVGVGVGYRFESGPGVLVAYDRYGIGDGDLNRTSLGVSIRF